MTLHRGQWLYVYGSPGSAKAQVCYDIHEDGLSTLSSSLKNLKYDHNNRRYNY